MFEIFWANLISKKLPSSYTATQVSSCSIFHLFLCLTMVEAPRFLTKSSLSYMKGKCRGVEFYKNGKVRRLYSVKGFIRPTKIDCQHSIFSWKSKCDMQILFFIFWYFKTKCRNLQCAFYCPIHPQTCVYLSN